MVSLWEIIINLVLGKRCPYYLWDFHSQDSELRPISCLRFWSFMEFSFASLVIWEFPIVVEYSIQVKVVPITQYDCTYIICMHVFVHTYLRRYLIMSWNPGTSVGSDQNPWFYLMSKGWWHRILFRALVKIQTKQPFWMRLLVKAWKLWQVLFLLGAAECL